MKNYYFMNYRIHNEYECTLKETDWQDFIMNIKNEIGSRIRAARNKFNLSLSELSKITDLKKSTISNWENGRRTPSLEDAKILSHALRVSAVYLLCMDVTDNPTDSIQSFDHFKKIPCYNTDNLKHEFTDTVEHWIPIPHHLEHLLAKEIFAFALHDNSMSERFKKNDIVVLEKNMQPSHGDYVLLKIKATHNILFRKLYIDNSKMEKSIIKFCSLNKEWPDISADSTDSYIILGVLKNNITIFF